MTDSKKTAPPEPNARVEKPALTPKPRGPLTLTVAEKWQRLLGGVALVLMVGLLVIVIRSTAPPPTAMPHPFDPLTTNEAELRRVTEAISRIVTAPADARRLSALEVLEAVSVQSPGAADLREACVSTYRGLHEAQARTADLRAILMDGDGGERSAAELTPAMRSRAGQMLREADTQRERATQSRARCEELFRTAVQRFGMTVERQRGM